MGRRGRPNMGLGAGPMMRGGRRAGGQKLGEGARARLLEAHQLKKAGRFAEAAAKFSEMAAMARERDKPRMASYLGAQAAQCHAQAGDQQGLVQATELALSDARTEADPEHSSRTFGELLSSLSGTAFAGAAPQFDSAIRTALGVAPHTPTAAAVTPNRTAPNRTQQRHLPTECGSCGAPVSATEVKFNESGHADCPYCGCILTA
jgi:hypothetical protein